MSRVNQLLKYALCRSYSEQKETLPGRAAAIVVFEKFRGLLSDRYHYAPVQAAAWLNHYIQEEKTVEIPVHQKIMLIEETGYS